MLTGERSVLTLMGCVEGLGLAGGSDGREPNEGEMPLPPYSGVAYSGRYRCTTKRSLMLPFARTALALSSAVRANKTPVSLLAGPILNGGFW
jgi:hypothetical protein